jgi:hypothetical protein
MDVLEVSRGLLNCVWYSYTTSSEGKSSAGSDWFRPLCCQLARFQVLMAFASSVLGGFGYVGPLCCRLSSVCRYGTYLLKFCGEP